MSRPLCGCHSLPMDKNGILGIGTHKWRCAVKVKQWHKDGYASNSAEYNYRRSIYRRRQRIREKRQLIRRLEVELAQEISIGNGEVPYPEDCQVINQAEAQPGSR